MRKYLSTAAAPKSYISPLIDLSWQAETEQLTGVHRAGVALLTGISSGHFGDSTWSYKKKSMAMIT